MRRHAKASSAESTLGRATDLGVTPRGASLPADGNGAPAGSRRPTLLAIGIFLASFLVSAAVASAAPPSVGIDATTSASFTTAEVSGKVDPKDNETYYSFEYSADPAGEGWSPFNFEGPLAANSPEATVSTEFSGLKPGTEYQVRLVAENYSEPSGPIVSAEPNPTFTTKATASPSDAATDPASDVSYTTAHLSGTIDPNGGPAPIRWFFEYAKDPVNEGWRSAGGEITGADAESADPVAIDLDIEELTPGSQYVFRLNGVDVTNQELLSPEPNRTFETLAVPTPTVTVDPVTVFTGTTAHFAGTIDPEAPLDNPAAFNVKYHFECTPACPGLKGERTISADSDSHSVDDDAVGLDPNTDYEVRLVASNEGGQSSDSASFKTEATGPEAISLPAASITETSAIIGGWVDPNGSAATYQVQYADNAVFSDATSVPASEDADAGSGQSRVAVARRITDLTPETEYFFRVVADGDAGDDTSDPQSFSTLAPAAPEPGCANAEFRVGPSVALPDCRAFERLTPTDKNGGDIKPGLVLGNDDVHVMATSPFLPSDLFFSSFASYFAHRAATGWQLRPGYAAPNDQIIDVNDDLSQDLIEGTGVPLSPEDTDKALDIYVRRGAVTELISKGSLDYNTGAAARYGGQSADGSHIVFESTEQLETADQRTEPAARQLYERFDGQTRVVGILPDARCAELSLPAGCVDPGGAIIGNGTDRNGHETGLSLSAGTAYPISADGQTIFFESPDPSRAGEHQQLYARVGASESVDVSASQCTRVAPVCDDTGHPATFQGAAKDGSRVFFSTAAQLVNADEDSITDLYSYELSSGDLVVISDNCEGPEGTQVDCGGADWSGAINDVAGVTTISDDGRRVYFTGPPSPAGSSALNSLYLYDQRTETTQYVAPATLTVFHGQGPSLLSGALGVSSNSDGSVLLFQSPFRLTAFDNGICRPSGGINAGCFEIYRFQVATGGIDCVSCGLTGELPIGDTTISENLGNQSLAGIGEAQPTRHSRPTRWLSDDGGTIAFQSRDALLVADVNKRKDVYLWRDGRLSLLSSGQAPADSQMAGVTADGRDIFFTTPARLVPVDTDFQSDLYDARIGGGFAADHPQPPATPCSGEACRAPASSPPAHSSPGSSNFAGSGNPRPPKACAKGKVRRSGKCVKREPRKRAQKAGHNRGGKR